MANIYDKQIETMQRLINYGEMNENNQNNKSVVEYHAEGADGKTYGIVRECNKYYIKVAPKKDTALVAEDYDYLGGFNNRKENEYNSYNVASKQFELKMKSLNEAHSENKRPTSQYRPVEVAEWQINETKEMRAELNRFNDIMYNVNGILSEDKNFTTKHTLPEAPASNPSTEKVNGPFTKSAVAKGDKEMKATKTDYKKAGAPFNEDGTIDDTDMQSIKNPKSSSNSQAYTEKPKYVQTGVAGQRPTGAKAVKMNEDKKVVKITEQQVLAWSDNPDYMDKTKGTQIGCSTPYDDATDCEDVFEIEIEECEGVCKHDKHTVGCGKVGSTTPFDKKVNETSYFHNDDVADEDQLEDLPDEVQIDEDEDMELPFPEVEDDYEEDSFDDEDELDENGPFKLDYRDYSDYMDDETKAFMESKIRRTVRESLELDDFGKHPAYAKAPMTLPANVEIELNGERDWNDDSVKGEEPFGQQIGSSAPYDEKVVNMIVDMVRDCLSKKKLSERKVLKVDTQSSPMGVENMPMSDMEDEMNDPEEENMGFDDEIGENPYDTDFDAGVEADEEEDPKHFIEQLSGKLSQSLRSYQESLPKPDAATAKYAAGMVVKAAIENLPQKDIKDILDKISADDQNDQEIPEGDEDANGEEQQMEFDGVESKKYVNNMVDEIYNDITQPHNDEETSQQRKPQNSYRKKPFVAPNFI